jgi:hypothetical protein
MRPDAETRQPHGSPTSAPSAPAPRKRGGGGRVLVGLGAVVLVLGSAAAGLAGGVLHGAASIQPRESGAAPDRAEERAEAAAAPEQTGERVEYRGMSVLLPEGWAAETVTDSFSGLEAVPQDSVTEEWLTLYPEGQQACQGLEWAWADTSTGCAHLKVLGPSALRLGRAGGGPVTLEGVGPHSSFSPGTNPAPCPEGVTPHTEADPGFRGIDQWDVTETKAGEEPAGYAEGSVVCSDPATGGLAYVDQRLWLIEGAEILVVDGYRLDEAEAVVASAEW